MQGGMNDLEGTQKRFVSSWKTCKVYVKGKTSYFDYISFLEGVPNILE